MRAFKGEKWRYTTKRGGKIPQQEQEVIAKIFIGLPGQLVFHPDTGFRQFPCSAGFVIGNKKNST